MNNYEALFIIKPDLKDAELENAVKGLKDLLAKHKAELSKEENWGKRQFAYFIKKSRDGVYCKFDFQSPPDAISKVKEACALNPEILRVMITKK